MKSVAVLRSVSRLAGKAVKLSAIGQIPVRAISTSHRAFNVAPELTQALTREIQAEQQLSQENLGGSAAPSFHGFNITTKDAEVRLTKQHGKESILVVFNVNHSVDMDEGFEDEAQPEDLHDLLFVRYLEERGFDAQFCKTLVAYATHYEHSQYVGLLNKIKAFVSK
ncbi:hypothetical protein ANCCAN_10199 [Ancylostoma caninum]|uniref:Complement component 1 Q subcomponent-binding protein, mitochondrial n=1 Tax=Ancylostoma caninum TaxID=29170 RepID=A0A368GL95_ANCCA|nr:hypothetical protein ANCCAN_10199 [Ancylostoma caninum]